MNAIRQREGDHIENEIEPGQVLRGFNIINKSNCFKIINIGFILILGINEDVKEIIIDYCKSDFHIVRPIEVYNWLEPPNYP